MRRYSKLLGLRAWSIVKRPVWAIIVAIGAIYTFLQVVARVQAERLVKLFDALHQWDPLYQWWYIPLVVIVLFVFLKAGYELWKEEEQARQKAEGQLRHAEQETEAQLTELREERDSLSSKIQELTTMSPEAIRMRREERQKRIESWRTAINDFDFNAKSFTDTDVFLEMKPDLRPAIVQRFEWGGLGEFLDMRLDQSTRGEGRHRRILLEEVARIERKWGLI